MCTCLLELISQYGPPALLSTDNGPPFASDVLTEFLTCQCIEHHTSSPHFPRSNGFIKRQVRTIKTMLNTALPAKKSLETVLLDLRSTPIGPTMPALNKILHNRAIQWPGKPSQPIDLEKVRNFLISRRQAQCDQFNKAHGAWPLPELPPGQEVLFRSPADDKYIPGTILEKAPAPQSYIIKAQGKRYCRTREHVQPIHSNLHPPAQQQQNSHRKQCISGPSPPKSYIPRPSSSISSLPRPPLPCQSARLPLHILCPLCSNKAVTVCPSEEDLLLHLSSITPLPCAIAQPEETWIPSAPWPASTPPDIPEEELEAESPGFPDSQTSAASYSLFPRLPITYNETALSHLQGRPQVKICNNLSIPFPSDSECSTDNTDGNQSSDDETDDSDGSTPAEVEADSSCLQIESLTAGTGMDTPTPQQDVWMAITRSYRPKTRPVLQKTQHMFQSKWGRWPHRCRCVPHKEQAFSGPSGPHFRTIRSQTFKFTLSYRHFKTIESKNLEGTGFNLYKTFLLKCGTLELSWSPTSLAMQQTLNDWHVLNPRW